MDEIRDLRKKEKFIIDDKYLNGYAKFCGIIATGVYISLCRHANKQQQCFPSKKLIAEELAISERSVYDAIKILEDWKIIKTADQKRKKDGSFMSKIYTLLDKTRWKVLPSAECAVGNTQHDPSATGAVNRRQVVPNKETHIEGNTLEGTAPQSGAGITSIIYAFKEINPSYRKLFANKTQRRACESLLEIHGQEKVLKVISLLPKTNKMPFMPSITTPLQLEDKWASLESGLLKEKSRLSANIAFQ